MCFGPQGGEEGSAICDTRAYKPESGRAHLLPSFGHFSPPNIAKPSNGVRSVSLLSYEATQVHRFGCESKMGSFGGKLELGKAILYVASWITD